MREHKQLRVEIKDAEQGRVEAIFATLNVKDHDGDVTLPGAFHDGQEVRISAFNHGSWDSALPVGKGVIREDGDRAVLDGQFFLNTSQGRDTFTTVKELGPLMEWSYGFDVTDSELGTFEEQDVRFLKGLDVFEVSPVLLGAGIGTGTVAVKDNKQAIPPHSTSTSTGTWDGPTMWTRVPADKAKLRAATAWVDPEGDPETKDAYKFIHHDIAEDGTVGPANIMGCVAGLAVINGGRGGTTIPDADKKGVYNHLARHLRDAGREPPDFNPKHRSFPDRAELVLGDVLALVDHAVSWGAGEVKAGRVVSAGNHARLTDVAGAMLDAHKALTEFLADHDPNKTRDAASREFVRFQRHLANI